MSEKELERVKRGRLLVTNQWIDDEERTWKFEFGFGHQSTITVLVNEEKFIDDEEIESVLDNCTLWLLNGTILLGSIIEDNIVLVDYKNNKYFLKKNWN